MNVRERIINKVISNVLNEAFNKFNKFGNNQNKGRSGSLTMTRPVIKKRMSKVTGQEKEYISTLLTHVWGDASQKLADAINSAVPKHVLSAVVDGRNVELRINIAARDEIPEVINKMGQAIKDLNDYDEKRVDYVVDNLYYYVDSVSTSEDEENCKKATYNTWEDILNRLNDPEVRARLLKYQMSNDYARQWGNVLSPDNVRQVLNQFPNASFVCERRTWATEFNRKVKPGATRICVLKPWPKNLNKKKLDKAAEQCGFVNWDNAQKETENSTQPLSNIRIKANPDVTKFHWVIMYDVSETIPPPDPKDDKWTEQFGLSDNIQGVLNSRTTEREKSLSAREQMIANANKEKITKTQENLWHFRRLQLQNFLIKKGIDIEPFKNDDNPNFIVKSMTAYAQKVLPYYNIIEGKKVEKICALVVAAVCEVCGIYPFPGSTARTLKKYFDNKNVSREESAVVYQIIQPILPKTSVRAQGIQTLN